MYDKDVWNLLYTKPEVEHYNGYTLVTLQDRTDSDWSFVYKKGVFTHAQLQQPSSGNPNLGVDYATREAAIDAAKAQIDKAEVVDLLQDFGAEIL